MKKILEKWKKYLLNESLKSSGAMKLYHFSSAKEDQIVLDPEYFISKRGAYSRNDYRVSAYPRVFFYVDPEEAENIVKSQHRNLFVASVDASDIYNLMEDPEGLLSKSKKASGQTRPDYTKIFKSLMLEDLPPENPEYAKYFKPIREEGAKKYRGVYYTIHGGDTQVVVWFEKVTANKQKESEEE